jgi:hypothetical protein
MNKTEQKPEKITPEKELKLLQKKHEEISNWMINNTAHPEFIKKVSERNSLSVQIEVKRQQKRSDWYTAPQRGVLINPIGNGSVLPR